MSTKVSVAMSTSDVRIPFRVVTMAARLYMTKPALSQAVRDGVLHVQREGRRAWVTTSELVRFLTQQGRPIPAWLSPGVSVSEAAQVQGIENIFYHW